MKHKSRIFEPLVGLLLTWSSKKSWAKEIKVSRKDLDKCESVRKLVARPVYSRAIEVST